MKHIDIFVNGNDTWIKFFDTILTNLTWQLSFNFFITKCFNMATVVCAGLVYLQNERKK